MPPVNWRVAPLKLAFLSDMVRYRSFSADVVAHEAHTEKKFPNPSYPLVNTQTFLGIEVEVEQLVNPSRVTYWNLKEDGSLRNNGKEFVSLPIRGASVEYALTLLDEALHKVPGMQGHEFTERTSVHVHMNVRDMTPSQIASFVLLYLACEPLLYEFAGGKRHKNIFCIPVNQTTLHLELFSFFTGVEKSKSRSVFELASSWSKYTGFNLLPIIEDTLGTIEFRHLEGTSDVKRILTWINLILCMKNYAIASSYEFIKGQVLELNSNSQYQGFLLNVFGEFSKYLTIQKKLWGRMESAVIFIKDCFISNEKFMRAVSKESALCEKLLELDLYTQKVPIHDETTITFPNAGVHEQFANERLVWDGRIMEEMQRHVRVDIGPQFIVQPPFVDPPQVVPRPIRRPRRNV